MENKVFMVLVFPDFGADTMKKMQAIMRFMDEGCAFVLPMEPEDEAYSFEYETGADHLPI